MPMFYTPKPRQFHYTPRFYDPKKEKWEALKKKYSNKQSEGNGPADEQQTETTDAELAYFEQRVREIENDEKRESRKLGFSDLFRRRKMPTFNYRPRFSGTDASQQSAIGTDSAILDKYSDADSEPGQGYKTRKIKIRRRFDMGDSDYMKPVSGGKIILYALLACLLLYLILF